MDSSFSCEFCEKKYRSKKALNLHVRLKHPESYADESVRQSFSYKKKYICSSYDQRFSSKLSLKTHIFDVHIDGSPRQQKIVCALEHCKVRLCNYKSYHTHLLSIHGVKTEEEKRVFNDRAGKLRKLFVFITS